MAKKKTPTELSGPVDPRGQDVVLVYTGHPDVHGTVPSRDLTGSDINRIAYVRELARREAKHATYRRAQDDDRPQPDLVLPPGFAKEDDLAAIADELVATGNFEHAPPPEEDESAGEAEKKPEAHS